MAKISVILSVHNGLPFLIESVNSVLYQTFEDFEFLICDDASTDKSYDFLKTLNDRRIKLFKNQQNKGLFPTLNFLIKHTTTNWIHLWSQDDIMYPNCLEEEINFINKHPEVPFFFCQSDIIDETGKIIKKYNANYTNQLISEKHLIKVSLLAGSITGNIATTVVNKKEIEQVGYFREEFKYSADFDLWERLSRGKNIGVINKPLIKLREHKEQLSKNPEVKIFQLRENKLILQNWLSRINDPKIKKKAIRGINWKIKPMFFGFGLAILKQKGWKKAKPYFVELNKWENLIFLSIKYLILKTLDFLGLKQKFYHLLFYKGYYN